MRSVLIRIAAGSALWLLALTAAQAHPLSPALLQLKQTAPTQYSVDWRVSPQAATRTPLAPVFPADCAAVSAKPDVLDSGLLIQRWNLRCQSALAGRPLRIDGLARSPINVILRLQRLQGGEVQALLDADQDTFMVPENVLSSAAGGVFAAYLQMGIEHLLSGLDHVLFVLGLLLLARRGRVLLLTITAFTLGHSLTLALAVLGVVRVNAALTELLIALSIVWLALEVVRNRTVGSGWAARRPWALAGGFGLLHGLGFAGALAQIGVPADAIPLSLLGFNLGIELGQLGLVAVVLITARLWRALASAWPSVPALRGLSGYLMGSVAACWVYERLAVFVS
ncbi:HupE/UreJ family protein [Sinimarinibacterium sp. CAU 1509]|uniref:HupE/UreJ family protein n=1 Tax=Sinimarinibacterium sp. CAU 1509 TaxID=2562283 RepID=UPI0010AD7E36|nr:HupE/UreJ family protein [Sinimarinibacterium sp. CAU 1509]TJY55547.1 HupE/UreJ family protein [Sinimarinibacterium sp. CAU 1509]